MVMVRCGLAKTRLRHPSLPFDSLPYPTRTICRRVRTYVRSVNHVATKRKEVNHIPWVWGSVVGAPLLASSSFTIRGKIIKSYCHITDLKNKNGSLRPHSDLHVYNTLECTCIFCNSLGIFRVALFPQQWQSHTRVSFRQTWNVNGLIDFHEKQLTYLLTWQANCAKEKHDADATTADHYFCLFSEKGWQKCMLTNQSMPFTKVRFQNKNNRLHCIKVGNRPLKLWLAHGSVCVIP